MSLNFQRAAPPMVIAGRLAPTSGGITENTQTVTETPAGTTAVAATAARSDFAPGPEKTLRPADVMPLRVTDTMLGIYRAKYGIDVGTVVFKDLPAKAAEVRTWCDSLAPGTCAWALGSTASGTHTFALAVGRSHDGAARCLLVDGMSPCSHRIVGELEKAFDGKLYVTPRIQRDHQLGCIVFAMRFLLMTRAPGLAEKVLKSLEDFDIQYLDNMPAVRHMGLDDLWQLAGWLAATQLRKDIPKADFLRARPLDNGGRHTKWTVEEFFDQRPYTVTTDVRNMYREVDTLLHDPSRSLVSAERRAYLQKRFLQYAAPAAAPAGTQAVG
jgi:hypothetical protein